MTRNDKIRQDIENHCSSRKYRHTFHYAMDTDCHEIIAIETVYPENTKLPFCPGFAEKHGLEISLEEKNDYRGAGFTVYVFRIWWL